MGDINMSDESYTSRYQVMPEEPFLSPLPTQKEITEWREWQRDSEKTYRDLVKLKKELEEKEKAIAVREEQLKDKSILVTDKEVPFLILSQFMCPECKCQLMTTVMADMMRIKIEHHKFDNCSRSLTYIIRPLAQFTQFI